MDGVASNRLQKASGRSAENNVTVKSWLEGPAGSGYFPVIGATAQAGLGTMRSGGLSTKLYPALTDRFCQGCGAVKVDAVVARTVHCFLLGPDTVDPATNIRKMGGKGKRGAKRK